MDKNQLRAQADEILTGALDDFMLYYNKTDGWEDLGTNDGVSGYQIFTEIGGHQLIKGVGVINHSAEKIIEVIYDGPNKKNWDEMLLETIDIVNFTPDYKIVYEKYHCPWPISDRDLVFPAKTLERPDGLICVAKSMGIEGFPDVEGVVRGDIKTCGYYLKRLSANSTETTVLICVDPMGSIPKVVVETISKSQVSNLNKIRAVLG